MKTTSLYLLGTIAAFCLALVAGAAAQSHVEKKPDKLLTELRAVPLASRFYDKMAGKELDLAVIRFAPPNLTGVINRWTTIIFSRGSEEISVSIAVYESAEEAKAPFGIHTNAANEIYNGHGEQGQKSYYNGFRGLVFRKGRFFVSIACRDEKLAERLADYADETISADLN